LGQPRSRLSFIANAAPIRNGALISRGDNGEAFAVKAMVVGPRP